MVFMFFQLCLIAPKRRWCGAIMRRGAAVSRIIFGLVAAVGDRRVFTERELPQLAAHGQTRRRWTDKTALKSFQTSRVPPPAADWGQSALRKAGLPFAACARPSRIKNGSGNCLFLHTCRWKKGWKMRKMPAQSEECPRKPVFQRAKRISCAQTGFCPRRTGAGPRKTENRRAK